MKVAIIGSRNLTVDKLQDYIPTETEEIVSGGARGIDSCAKEYADVVIAFWDGKSKGAKFVIDCCEERKGLYRVVKL